MRSAFDAPRRGVRYGQVHSRERSRLIGDRLALRHAAAPMS